MILLNAEVSKGSSFWQTVGVLIIFLIVIGLCYWSTTWIAGYQKSHSYHKNLRLIETLKLTNNKYIQILEAGDEYLVIAVGKDEINLLTKLTKEQMKALPEELAASDVKNLGESFQDVLEKIKGRMPKK